MNTAEDDRALRVASGLEQLDRWLEDQVRGGLSALQTGGYHYLEQVAVRLVDSQAPGVARWVRGLAGVLASGPGWPSLMLEELALMRLLVTGHRRLSALQETDPELAATVRGHVGYRVTKAEVLTRPPVEDVWDVLALRDEALEDLRSRTVWLRGRDSGRLAVVLSFAPAGGTLDASLRPHTAVRGGLHFHPGALPSRAVVGPSWSVVPFQSPPAVSGEAALEMVAAAVAADPWVRSVPVVLDASVWLRGTQWNLVTREGAVLPLQRSAPRLWELLTVSGGDPLRMLVEWTPFGWRPVTHERVG